MSRVLLHTRQESRVDSPWWDRGLSTHWMASGISWMVCRQRKPHICRWTTPYDPSGHRIRVKSKFAKKYQKVTDLNFQKQLIFTLETVEQPRNPLCFPCTTYCTSSGCGSNRPRWPSGSDCSLLTGCQVQWLMVNFSYKDSWNMSPSLGI